MVLGYYCEHVSMGFVLDLQFPRTFLEGIRRFAKCDGKGSNKKNDRKPSHGKLMVDKLTMNFLGQ